MRSRAESLPALCSRSRRSAPPPASASAEMRRNCSMRSAPVDDSQTRFFSAKRPSLGLVALWSENQHRRMRGQPDGAEQQHHSEQNFRRMAPARGSGDSIEVTYRVARTRMTIALSVVATIISVVRMERYDLFHGWHTGRRPASQSITHSRAKLNSGDSGHHPASGVATLRLGKRGSKARPTPEDLSQAGPVVGDHDRIAGIRWIVLHAGRVARSPAVRLSPGSQDR